MNTHNLTRYMDIGAKDKHWYKDCKKSMQDILPHLDINLVIDVMAATSMNTSLKANISLFIKMYHIIQNDLPFPSLLPAMEYQLRLVKEGKPLHGRKIFNFSEAMKGNKNAVVVDLWICRAFGVDAPREFRGRMKDRSPTKKTYDNIESYIRSKAPVIGLEPRQMCSMIWSGVRTEATGKNNTTRYSELLSYKVNTLFPLI